MELRNGRFFARDRGFVSVGARATAETATGRARRATSHGGESSCDIFVFLIVPHLLLAQMGEGRDFPCAAARPLPFSLILFPFRPSIGLFGVPLQSHAPEKKEKTINFNLDIIISIKNVIE